MTIALHRYQIHKSMIRRFMPFIFLILFSFLISHLSAENIPVDFKGFAEVGQVSGQQGEFKFAINWQPESGYELMVADKNKQSQCFIRLNKKDGIIWIQGRKTSTGILTVKKEHPLPEKPVKQLDCILKLQQHAWSLYLNNKEVFQFSPPFQPDSLWFQQQVAAGDKKHIRFQKTAPLYFHDDFLIEGSDDNQLDSWEKLNGDWHIHSALDAALEQKTSDRLQKRPLEAERSPNFYSLKGSGENSLIVAGYPFHDNYLLQAAIQVHIGESGLAFYVQDEKNYYTFTVLITEDKGSYALLKKHRAGQKPLILKAVKLSLLAGQWIMPKVQVMEHRIEAFIDNIKIMDIAESLPAGGQFGLYVNSKQTMFFDDITAESLPYIILDSLQDVKFNTLAFQGDVFYKPGFFDWLLGKGKEKELFPGSSKKDRWVVVGKPSDKIAVAGVSFTPKSVDNTTGLLFGWQNEGKTSFRFMFNQSGSGGKLQLEQVDKGSKIQILETWDIVPENKSGNIALKAELAPDGLIQLYCNDQLVMIYKTPEAIIGAAGIFVGKHSAVSIETIQYRFKPKSISRDRREKNEIFSHDPFMKHWASPEGAWIKDEKDVKLWHKSDFFGAFSLSVPLVDNAEINLGVKDDQPTGEIIVRTKGADFEIVEAGSEKPLFKKAIKEVFPRTAGNKLYKLSVKNSWVWGELNNNLLFKVNLKKPLTGTKIFIKGFSDARLGEFRAVRDNVKDFLFTEAPYDWVRNGGTWQVINRFKCDPRWSHMNGQSEEDLASLWSKYQFEGDFCLEMYAGIRHGDWYERVGDLNLTVMNDKFIPEDGYTFICSGWDPDHSQTKSRFFRNGKLIESSDKYLTPRRRDGNVRKFFNPLINRGRDVHGAWYYIKVRRIGDLIEYYFDNEKIFSMKDKNPMNKGGFGIWTFMNSMMVARVKIASEKITPKGFYFAEIDPGQISRNAVKNPVKPAFAFNDLPSDLMTDASWKEFEGAGESKLSFFKAGADSAYLLENILGAGMFAAEAKDLIFPEKSISAWTCDLKRTANARFNYHFELGRRDANGKYQTLQRYFYQITGTDYSKGLFQRVGQAGAIQPVKLQQIQSAKNWTRVWFPVPYILPKFGSSSELVWKVIGFGNYEPSDIVQGLQGNEPGSAYAVKNFHPIFYKVPKVSVTDIDQKKDITYQLKFDGMVTKAESMEKLNQRLQSIVCPGLVSGNISIPGQGPEADLQWVNPDHERKWSCRWDTEKYDAIIISADAHYRYLNNALLQVSVQGVEFPVEVVGVNKFRISLLEKYDNDLRTLLQDDVLNIEIKEGDKKKKLVLSWKDAPAVAPPILTKLDGITHFFLSFETPDFRKGVHFDPNRMAFIWDKEIKANCLEIANKSGRQRLQVSFNTGVSAAQYPLLQFRYKTDPMGQISLKLHEKLVTHLSEPHSNAKKVRFADELIKDGKWHTWIGYVADTYEESKYSPTLFQVPVITFASFHAQDQTGVNSRLFLNDMVWGPAVSNPEQLAFTPHYYDRKEGTKVYSAITPGLKAYYELKNDEKKKIVWKEFANNTRYVPDLSNTTIGPNQLLLKAVSKNGLESQITSIPFLYDKTASPANFAFQKTDDPAFNDSLLQISLPTQDGAPINFETLTTAFDGTKVAINKGYNKIKHRTDTDIIEINWPLMLRSNIQKMNNGETKELVLSGLTDGAGNRSADLRIPIKMDFAKDKLPPTYLNPDLPKSIYYHVNAFYDKTPNFPFIMKNIESAIQKDDSGYFSRFSCSRNNGHLIFINKDKKHVPTIYLDSYLAMGLRFPPDSFSKASMSLNIQYSNNRRIQINLLNGQISGGEKIANLDSKRKGWQNFAIDLQQIYQQRFDRNNKRRNELKDIYIQGITLTVKNMEKKDFFDLNLYSLFTDVKADEKLVINAFDQSGTGELIWKLKDNNGKELHNGKFGNLVFEFKQLTFADDVSWLELAVTDRAGNQAKPMLFPLTLKSLPKPKPKPVPVPVEITPAVKPEVPEAKKENKTTVIPSKDDDKKEIPKNNVDKEEKKK